MATAPTTDKSLTAMAAEFGIVTVADDAVPAAPRSQDRDTVRWNFLAQYLPEVKNTWVKAKTFDKPGSAQVYTSNINNGKHKTFPSDKYEARYEKSETNSTLYLRYKG